MFLEKIELKGFKSFAQELKIDFYTGITSIVGPNGSGKSNITDAIRWVLGEQKHKVLRGEKMEDVIFNGTSVRKPLSYAYVALFFDNSQGMFNIEYEKVVLKRKYYRTGESEYYINESQVRLRDVRELLMDTGIGVDGYSIIGQGDIDKILSDNKFDRRSIIEEAAGTVKFSHQREEALRKLENAKINIERVSDIFKEITSRLSPLEVQKNKALEYKRLSEEIRNSDIYYLFNDYLNAESSLRERQESLEALQKKMHSLQNDIGRIESSNKTNVNDISKLEHDLKESESEKYDISLEIDRLEYSHESAGKDQETHSKEATRFYKEAELVDQEVSRLLLSLETGRKQAEKLSSDLNDITDMLSDVDYQIELQKKAIDDTSIISLQDEIGRNKVDREISLSSIQLLSDKMIQLANEKKDAQTKLESAKAEHETRVAMERNIQSNLQSVKETLSNSKLEVSLIEKNLADKKTSLDREYANLQSLSTKKDRNEASLLSMQKSLSDYDVFGYNFKTLMDFIKKQKLDGMVEGTVSDLLTIPQEFETAIATALGRSLSNIVVESSDDAKLILKKIKESKIGSATFLPYKELKRSKASFSSSQGVFGLASSLVEHDSKYSNLVDYLLSGILIVDNIDTAVSVSKGKTTASRIVTTDGDVVVPNGPITGGYSAKKDNIFTLKRKLSQLSTEHETIKRQIDKSEQLIGGIRAAIEKDSLGRRSRDSELVKLAEEVTKLESSYSIARMDSMHSSSILEKEQVNIDQFDLMLEKYDLEVDQLRQQIIKLEEHSSNLEDEMKLAKENTKQLSDALETLLDLRSNKAVEHAKLQQELYFTIEKNESIESTLTIQKDNLDKIEAQIVTHREAQKNSSNKAEEIKQLLEKKKRKLDNLVEEIRSTQEKLNSIKAGYNRNLDEKNDIIRILEECKDESHGINLEKYKFESRMSDISFRIWEDYEISMIDARMLHSQIKPVTKTELNACKKHIKALGPINMESISEFQEVKERHDFMKTQLDDLISSRAKLSKLIHELEGSIKERFKTTFDEVNVQFNETVVKLFGGGYGKLILTDEQDLLTTDIDIVVMPPGKKLSHLNLMSGGEKTLSAISLLFAVLKVKPSPFCVLDEIEAALDDNNITRFGEFIRNFSNQIQFILITHKRGTMEISDYLYGVTMEEKGVSKIISIDLIDYKE